MRRICTAAVLLTLAAAGCKRTEAPVGAPPPAPAAAAPAAAAPAQAGAQQLRGKIVEKIDVSQYSYLKLATPSGEVWAAVERTDKKAGDEVAVSNPFPMQNFESKELGRKFDTVYFGSLGAGSAAGAVEAAAAPAGAPGAAPDPSAVAAQHQMAATGPDVKVAKVAKAGGAEGRTVQELWGQREKLKGKPVAVRGQVVKFTAVMGRNFLHLRDGSGSAEKKDNDVTVTTNDQAAVGDVVTARGVVAVDKDFGAGYAYPVLVEDAKLAK